MILLIGEDSAELAGCYCCELAFLLFSPKVILSEAEESLN